MADREIREAVRNKYGEAAPLDLLQSNRSSARIKVMEGFYNVLFLCTGNSARSIMAEVILNRKGRPTFKAYSAGSHATGRVRPEALKQLELAHLPIDGLQSKNWDEFAQPGAPQLHFVFTVCDNAAKEVCPTWPGQPMTAHWGVPDPAAVAGTPEQIERAFREAFYNPRPQNRPVPVPSPFESRSTSHQERNRSHRPTMRASRQRRFAASAPQFMRTGTHWRACRSDKRMRRLPLRMPSKDKAEYYGRDRP